MRAFADAIVRWRMLVILLSLALTAFFGLNLRGLNVIVDADELLPRNHPFVEVTEHVQALFGNRYTVVIGVTPQTGDVYRPEVLGKVMRITERLAATPGVNSTNLQSLAAPRAKSIAGNADGLLVERLLDQVPPDRPAARAIAGKLRANPAYDGILVGRDGRTAAIYAEFKKDPAGFEAVMAKVEAAIAPERGQGVSIAVAGQPVFLAALETFSKRMAYLLPIAILLIGLIHLEAFRTIQGLVLPLVTAILAVIWSLGLMSIAGTHLDPFNNVTPILILAVAAGHAVQVLKRYYEEYDRLIRSGIEDARAASRQAVVEALVRVGPVMIAAGGIAAIALMSLMIFDIQSIRTFGFFSGVGILSVIVVELTFTPALRAMLPAPTRREQAAERKLTGWDRIAAWLAAQVSTPGARRRVFIGWAAACAVFVAGGAQVVVDNSLRGFFGESLQQRRDDKSLNTALAGTNTFYVLVEGKSDDAIKDPRVLQAMEKVQAFLEAQPEIGHTLSIVDMLKQINMGLQGGDARQRVLPADPDLISQYLLLYSMSGEPGDFDGLVDYPYKNALIQAFVKTDSSAFVARLDSEIRPLIARSFPPDVRVRLGGSITTPTAMNEAMVRDKLINIAQLMLVVFVISALVFRSVSLAALILVPLIVTTAATFGVMGLSGIPLQIATATVAALAIGIGADYAIYFTFRLREELRARPEVEAIAVTYASAGKAVMFVATAVAGGYAVLMASPGFNIHFWLGLLITLAMAVAAFGTLTLFVALLLAIRPRVIFGGAVADAPRPRLALQGSAGAALLVIGALLLATPAPAQAQDARQLMAEALQSTKLSRSIAVGRFRLVNKDGQTRVRDVTSTSELKPDGVNNRRVVRFNSPADVRGTAVLTIENGAADDDIWVYLPAMKKVRRLTASNKKDAFVGTDFSYGDVIGHPVEDWTHRLVRAEAVDGVRTRVVESLPRSPAVIAATGYSKRVSWLREGDNVPLKIEYFGPGGALAKVYTAADIRLVDTRARRFQPMRQAMRTLATGHTTIIEYANVRTDASIAAETFTPRALENAR